MKIAVASGKGGTGKTLIATNLAYVAAQKQNVQLVDLDVEEPNAHIFINDSHSLKETVRRMIPLVDEKKCNYCGICSDVCEYHAIITLTDTVMVFPELCHSCYGCLEMCPENAISESYKSIGDITVVQNNSLKLITGKLKVGESATTALIAQTKKKINTDTQFIFFDAPPGISCPVIEAIKDVDFVLVVAEPTPFGLHDLNLMYQTVKKLNRESGIVLNKAIDGNTIIEEYSKDNNLEILMRLPFDPEIAREYSKGNLISQKYTGKRKLFENLFNTIKDRIQE
jgi:MinD superfamily P-loop ATPase